MTDTTEIKKMEETMENNKEVPSSGVDKQADELTDISEEDEIPDLIVDHSEGSEGSIHEQLSSKQEEDQKITFSTDKEDNTKYTEVMETMETRYPNLDPGILMKISVNRIGSSMKRLGIQNSQNNRNSRWQQ